MHGIGPSEARRTGAVLCSQPRMSFRLTIEGKSTTRYSLTLPAGTWVVFENTGPYPQALQNLSRGVATEWFPSNPYASRPGPEILRTRPSQDGRELDTQLWIPVERTPV